MRASGRVHRLFRLARDRPPVARVGYGPRDAERLGAILLQTLRVSRRRAFRTGRPSAGIGRRQPSASQVSGTAPKPSRLSCPLPAVRSTPYPPRADARDYAPAQMTGHKFFEMGLRAAAALGVAKMNACRLMPTRCPQSASSPACGGGGPPSGGGGGGHKRRSVGPPPSVGFAPTFPRTREKGPAASFAAIRPVHALTPRTTLPAACPPPA